MLKFLLLLVVVVAFVASTGILNFVDFIFEFQAVFLRLIFEKVLTDFEIIYLVIMMILMIIMILMNYPFHIKGITQVKSFCDNYIEIIVAQRKQCDTTQAAK